MPVTHGEAESLIAMRSNHYAGSNCHGEVEIRRVALGNIFLGEHAAAVKFYIRTIASAWRKVPLCTHRSDSAAISRLMAGYKEQRFQLNGVFQSARASASCRVI